MTDTKVTIPRENTPPAVWEWLKSQVGIKDNYRQVIFLMPGKTLDELGEKLRDFLKQISYEERCYWEMKGLKL